MAESNAVKLRYVSEGTYGTTPTNDSNWQQLVFSDESLTAEQDKRSSANVDGERILQDKIEVRRNVGGSITADLRIGWFDDLILAAMCGDQWDSDIVTLGDTDYGFSIEKEYSDLSSGNRFRLFNGMRVSGMNLNMAHGDIVTIGFEFQGLNETGDSSSAVGTGSEATQDTNKRIISAAAGFGSFEIDDAANSADIMSATFNVNNNHEGVFALGSIGAADRRKGDGVVTGTLNTYLDTTSLALYERSLNNTDTKIEFTLTDESTSPDDFYKITIPKAIITSVTPRSQGRNQRVMAELNYEAITSAVTIERSIS